MKQRLCIYLDGTWNTENNSTNVQHGFNLTMEGIVRDRNCNEWRQLKYYDRGVGTGVLDGITGGMLGMGIDKNIKEAYVWLVQNYREGDQIFIFGFSRGAFAARALATMITSKGIVKRGAPYPVDEIWKWYVSENTKNEKKKIKYKYKLESGLINNAETDRYKRRWLSKDNRVHYLGIFDTVGAMGLGALGIPGLGLKHDKKYNYYPKTLIESCRHAISVDENRVSFDLKPIQEYVRNHKSRNPKFINQIEQKWFPGAHSNIGGGYDSNHAAIGPFKWVMEGAVNKGLVFENYINFSKESEFDKKSKIRNVNPTYEDSFLTFMGVIWPHFLREKRNFRQMLLLDDYRSKSTLMNVNESISDELVYRAKEDREYCPPNLKSYTERVENLIKIRKNEAELVRVLKKRSAKFSWEALSSFGAILILVIWSIVSGVGFYSLLNFIGIKNSFGLSPFIVIAGCSLCVMIFDFSESFFSFMKARLPEFVSYDVWWYVSLWHRIMFLCYFIIGIIYMIFHFSSIASVITNVVEDLASLTFSIEANKMELLASFGGVLLLIFSILILMKFKVYRNKNTDTPLKLEMKKKINFIYLFVLCLFMYSCLFFGIEKSNLKWSNSTDNLNNYWSYFGSFILLSICLYGLVWVWKWASLPMSAQRANLGSVFQLQMIHSRNKRNQLFEKWQGKLPSLANPNDTPALLRVIKTSVLRDSFGWVPLFAVVSVTFLYVSSSFNMISMDSFVSVRQILILIFAYCILDWIENYAHLGHLYKYLEENEGVPYVQGIWMTNSILKTVIFVGISISMLYIYSLFFIKVVAPLTSATVVTIGLVLLLISTAILSHKNINVFNLIKYLYSYYLYRPFIKKISNKNKQV